MLMFRVLAREHPLRILAPCKRKQNARTLRGCQCLTSLSVLTNALDECGCNFVAVNLFSYLTESRKTGDSASTEDW